MKEREGSGMPKGLYKGADGGAINEMRSRFEGEETTAFGTSGW